VNDLFAYIVIIEFESWFGEYVILAGFVIEPASEIVIAF
jgi:hypothetical protein